MASPVPRGGWQIYKGGSPFFVLAPSLGHFFPRFRIIFPHFSVKWGGSPSPVIFFHVSALYSPICVKCGVPVPGPWVRVKGGGPPFSFFAHYVLRF